MPDSMAEPHDPLREHQELGRQRLRDALLKPTRRQVVVAVLLAIMGFGVVTQVRTTGQDDSYAGVREQDLIEMLDGLTGAANQSRRDIARLEQAKRELQSDTVSRQTAVDEVNKRLETLNILAGLVPVQGPGLKIVVTEESGRMRSDTLLDAVEELRTAGAEAFAINGVVRLGAQSSFTEVVGGVEIDGQVVSSPYTIEVIGEPRTLEGALTFPDGPLSQWENDDGCQVTITPEESLQIKVVRTPVKPQYASPD